MVLNYVLNFLQKQLSYDRISTMPYLPQIAAKKLHTHSSTYPVSQVSEHVSTCGKKKQKSPQQNFFFMKASGTNSLESVELIRVERTKVDQKYFKRKETSIKKQPFQTKEAWFQYKLQNLRIPWTSGSELLQIQRDTVIQSSILATKTIDMHKEVKIKFMRDKVDDAGGLLREWIHLVIQEIFKPQNGLFQRAKTKQLTYKLKWDYFLQQKGLQILNLFGIVIGKAIFEKIPLNCFLDRTIIKQLCGGEVTIEEIQHFDEQLYKNWCFLLKTEEPEVLDIDFVMEKEVGTEIKSIELIENGSSVKVTNENKELYVKECIHKVTVEMVEKSLTSIKQGIQSIFPVKHFSIFTPEELQMMMFGIPKIDLQNWQKHTEYKEPYFSQHKIIKWFWDVMEKFSQQQLSKILHFCTGSSRMSIYGFHQLSSNRGICSKFTIERCDYDEMNPYPRGHTCFNRLSLPEYEHYEDVFKFLTAISESELDGVFGLE